MKNYFLHVEKEKNFDQAEINITAGLKNNNSTVTTTSVIVEKTIKNFVNKNILELLDDIYLNLNSKSSVLQNDFDKQQPTEANSHAKVGIADLNLKFFIAKNFLKEKNFANKFYIEIEKLKDNRQDEKLNKIIRKLKNFYFSANAVVANSNNTSAAAAALAVPVPVPVADIKQSYAIIVKENDFFLMEKNLKAMDADYKIIDKGKKIIYVLFFEKLKVKNGKL